MNTQKTLLSGALFGALAVTLGAFGAHALKSLLIQAGRVETYELAVRYQFYHAFALLIAGLLQNFFTNRFIKLSGIFFSSGILLFSGSLYLFCFSQNTTFAMITPLGGALLIIGWIFLTVGVFQTQSHVIKS